MPNSAQEFLRSVRALAPRIAVFDCDGTLWSNNAGEEFFFWSMGDNGGHRIVSEEIAEWAPARYADYLAGIVDEETMCGEMTTMYHGLQVSEIEVAAEQFIRAKIASSMFLEMRELTRGLAAQGCQLWAVSSTNEWVIRAGLRGFPIPSSNILAATVTVKEGIASDNLIRVPTGPTKATAIREFVHGGVDMVFGNSVHDAAMLELARHAFAVNPNPDLEALAKERGWTIYWPVGTKDAVGGER